MMTRWLRLLPMLIAALWLPFQAVAANAMPLCRHGQPHEAVAVQVAADHCAMHSLHQEAPAQPDPAPADHGLGCDQCGFCHLAGAGYLPAAERIPQATPADRGYAASAALIPPSHIPEPPQQPPRRAA
jgi:hypothetical protein